MSISEVAEQLHIHRNTALRLVRRGRIPGGELLYRNDDGRERWRVDGQKFEAWLSKRPKAA